MLTNDQEEIQLKWIFLRNYFQLKQQHLNFYHQTGNDNGGRKFLK